MTTFQFKLSTLAIAILLGASGCANTVPQQKEITSARLQSTLAASSEAQTNKLPTVRETQQWTPRGFEIESIDPRRAVNLKAENATALSLVQQIAGAAGYSVTAMSGVDASKRITIEVKSATTAQAIRSVAWASGLAVVINDADKSVVIANEASYVFKLPVEAFNRLITNFNFGGSPLSGGGSSGGAGGGGGAAGGGAAATQLSAIRGDFSVQGTYGTNPQGLSRFITDLAGANATVNIFAESGLIEIRGNGHALKRAHEFLEKFSADSRRQIEISAEIAEVTLANEFKYGIQWDKVLNAAGTRTVGLDTLGSIGSGTVINVGYNSTSITSLIRALEKFTDLEIQSSPRLFATNNSGAVIFEGKRVPFLPSVTQTPATVAGGQPTITGTGALAQDGVNLAVQANILDDNNAILRILPTSVSLGDLKSFLNNQIQIFEETIKVSGQSVAVQHGQTLIISGNRTTKASKSRAGVPGLVNLPVVGAATSGITNVSETRETVVLLNVRILRPNAVDVIFSQSI
jgi:type II secretory pathway component GspD/PulD (secretin)